MEVTCAILHRFKQENIVFVGLWYHKSKPQFNTYMVPIAHRLNKLYHEGLDVTPAYNFDNEGNPLPNFAITKVNVKGVLLTGTLDNPARDMVLNKCGHGGKDGCFCKEVGKNFPLDDKRKGRKRKRKEGKEGSKEEKAQSTIHVFLFFFF